MVYKKIEYREFNSLEEIVRWEELNLDKNIKLSGEILYILMTLQRKQYCSIQGFYIDRSTIMVEFHLMQLYDVETKNI